MDDMTLLSKAKKVALNAYSPYSQFKVGAALLSESGEMFTGCNVESASYGACICGERTALVKAVSEGERRFSKIAIVGSGKTPCYPCGICRQMLAEFSPNLIVLAGSLDSDSYETLSIAQLLPHAFTGDALG